MRKSTSGTGFYPCGSPICKKGSQLLADNFKSVAQIDYLLLLWLFLSQIDLVMLLFIAIISDDWTAMTRLINAVT